MSEVLCALRWYLIVQLFGFAALPLCLRLFRFLPDRGYGVSKPFGLLLSGWVFWILTTMGWTRNTVGGILIAVGVVVVAGLIANRQSPIANRQSSILIAVTELLFLASFVAWSLVRANMPHIETAGGEKWMEIAFLRAILRSETFPPHDPWLSGFAISYYYFGYLMIAMLTCLSAVPPSIAFNLGIASWFALVCAASFSMVYNLLAVGRKTPGRLPWLGGFLGPLLVAITGNLEGFLEWLHARGIGPAAVWAWLDVRNINGPPPALADGTWAPTRFFWWWQASRVVQDYTPWGTFQEVIDEFPAFSFILGDMHPHLLALPFVLLALALALNLYLRIRSDEFSISNSHSLLPDFPFRWWEFALYALVLGGLGFLNTWDFPIYLFVVAAAYLLALVNRSSLIAHRLSLIANRLSLIVLLPVVGVLLYFPFWVGFRSQAGGVLPNLFNPTRLPHFLIMFGPLFFIAAMYVAGQAARAGVRAGEVLMWTLVVAFAIIAILAVGIGLLVLFVRGGLIEPGGVIGYVSAWLHGEPISGLENVENVHALISQRILSRLYNQWTSLSLIALLAAIVLLLLRLIRPNAESSALLSQSACFVLLLYATGALLALSVEYVYLRDHFGTRMNTVFKFYFQTWVMWAIGGAYVLAILLRRLLEKENLKIIFILLPAFLLIGAGLLYPLLAIPARARESGGEITLDGAAYLAQTQPDDYAAIAWLNENVDGAPVILEAPGDHFRAYIYAGRISAHTGLPTLLGWGNHQHQWRGDYTEPARREPDIETLYTSTDLARVQALLDQYHVEYVYVGPLEKSLYPPAGLAKFASLLEIVYQRGNVTIYRVPR